MTPNQNSDVSARWVGGFAESNPAFAYPDPDLTSLPMLDNMENIDLIKLQQKVIWPEFSWETEPGRRCFQRFSRDISRVGYDSTGRVWSIICPQQGHCIHNVGCMNLEVTVTGQRGWVNETTKEIAADMTVEGTIWFTPLSRELKFLQFFWEWFSEEYPFPFDKKNAIKVTTHKVGDPEQPIFPGRKGETTAFHVPDFARHPEKAWAVGNLQVEIGPIKETGNEIVDRFNKTVLDLFNIASGNILKSGNVLTWNLWFKAPEPVDTQEWTDHAKLWRESIEADHGSPTGPGSKVKYADGTPFEPFKHEEEVIEEMFKDIKQELKSLKSG